MSIETPANPPVDAFEAALAVNESAPVIEESVVAVIEDVVEENPTPKHLKLVVSNYFRPLERIDQPCKPDPELTLI